MIYLFLKRIVRFTFFIFFRKKRVYGLDRIASDGPLIIAVNHPNTLIDPLLVASQIKRRVGFLANASIFINGFVKAIFKYFSVIPVYRKKDLKPGEVRDNSKSFEKCYEFFDKNGAILIFPEGTSVNELKLREIKTGAARIALNYEAERAWPGILSMNTVALSYSDSLRFRSMVSMYINMPFKVKEYEKLWKENEEEAIRVLTERIKLEIEGQITLTDNKEQERLVLQGCKFFSEYIDTSIGRYNDPEGAFKLRKEMATNFRQLENEDPSAYDTLSARLSTYFNKLDELKVSPGFFRSSFLKKGPFWVLLSYLLEIIILFPLYILGLISNYLPYKIPDWIYYSLKVDEEYKSSISVVFGMIIFPIYYAFLIYMFRVNVNTEIWWSVLLLLSFPFLGLCTLFYYKIMLRFGRIIRFYQSINKQNKMALIRQRNDLISIFDRFVNLP